MLPVNTGGHTAYQDSFVSDLLKFYPDPFALPKSTWNYIVQSVVDSKNHFIIDISTTNDINDQNQLYTRYEPQQVLEDFTEEFRKRYGVECVSALHHNKRKTNYHIHLIFSERKLLPEPDIKIATRNVFYDETGKRVRTKKEITGEDGKIRKGYTVIKKGEIYESYLFTVKYDKFKSEPFLRKAKEVYTNLINRHISDPEQHLKVFDKNSVIFPQRNRKE